MSMDENLEVKVNELTNVIKGLSDRPVLSSQDINNLTKRVEETNEQGFNRLTRELAQSLLEVLNQKNEEIKERLSLFETFATSVEKNVSNPKVENEITRILNDIEALHSKMSSQELQTEGLIKSFDAMKNSSSAGQITKLADEIVAVSRSYDGIVDVLNNNFEEFLRRVEAMSSKEEFMRLRQATDAIEDNQNVLVSAMNAINEKQEEIKNLIKQSANAANTETFEQIQNALNQMNGLISDTTSKAELALVSDKISNVIDLLSNFGKSFGTSKETGFESVFSGQLNNIINRLESLKLNSGTAANEDIIRLYNSIAEFKDSVYGAINTQLNNVVASMDVQFDKISNSFVNSALDTSENMSNLTSEVQKLNAIMSEGLNAKTIEIKENFQRLGQDNVITIVNSIKGELSNLASELASINSNDAIKALTERIEAINAGGSDLNAIVLELDKLKSELDLAPIKEQLAFLNNSEGLKTISRKIDLILDSSKSMEIIGKLDEIKSTTDWENVRAALEAINQKMDFTSIEAKISSLKELFSNTDFSRDLISIKEKLGQIDNIGEELVAFKNIDGALAEIKKGIEESVRFDFQKVNENKQSIEEIKEALKTIYRAITESNGHEAYKEAISELKETVNSLPSKVDTSFENERKALETSFTELSEKLNLIDIKLMTDDDEKLSEIKEQIELLHEFVKEVTSKSLTDKVDDLKEKLLQTNTESIKGLRANMNEFQNALALSFNAIRSGIAEHLDKDKLGESFLPMFDDFSSRLGEKLASIETLIEETAAQGGNSAKESIMQSLEASKADIKTSIMNFVQSVLQEKVSAIEEALKNQTNEARIEMANYLKQESEILTSFLNERAEITNKELLAKMSQMLSGKENSEAKINLIRSITENLSEVLENTNYLKNGLLANGDTLNIIRETLELLSAREGRDENGSFDSVISAINKDLEQMGSKMANSLGVINSNIEDKISTISANTEILQNDFKDVITQSNTDIKSALNDISERSISESAKLNDLVSESNANFENALNSIYENISSINSKMENTKEGDQGGVIDALDDLNRSFVSIQDKIEDSILTNNEKREKTAEIISALKDTIERNFDDNRDKINNLKDDIANAAAVKFSDSKALSKLKDEITELLIQSANLNKTEIENKIGEIAEGLHSNIDNKMSVLKEDINTTNAKIPDSEVFNKLKEEVVNALTSSASSNKNEIENKMDEIAGYIHTNINNTRNKTEEITETLKSQIAENLKAETEEIKAVIEKGLVENKENDNALLGLSTIIEQKMNDKISVLEALIEENVNKLDSKSTEILNSTNEKYLALLNEKFEQLKLMQNRVAKIESILVKQDEGQEGKYTLQDVEADIAKIRFGIERNNKLSNFKEFASRLVELKNINLENAKISRVIGTDIMRFDSWLKNTTSKIEMLSNKIEKSEKIKMEDLKNRVIQTDKNQMVPQKVEEAIVSIYKKYRVQESKLDDMLNRLETLHQRRDDSFDFKEFIDLFYDNTKRQENLISRMDGLEDKMDLIQAKIDHIISSCLDE